eukprot:COSAG01_NODE_2747_length_7149_cov_5.321844_10_plen_118_part_00
MLMLDAYPEWRLSVLIDWGLSLVFEYIHTFVLLCTRVIYIYIYARWVKLMHDVSVWCAGRDLEEYSDWLNAIISLFQALLGTLSLPLALSLVRLACLPACCLRLSASECDRAPVRCV